MKRSKEFPPPPTAVGGALRMYVDMSTRETMDESMQLFCRYHGPSSPDLPQIPDNGRGVQEEITKCTHHIVAEQKIFAILVLCGRADGSSTSKLQVKPPSRLPDTKNAQKTRSIKNHSPQSISQKVSLIHNYSLPLLLHLFRSHLQHTHHADFFFALCSNCHHFACL